MNIIKKSIQVCKYIDYMSITKIIRRVNEYTIKEFIDTLIRRE